MRNYGAYLDLDVQELLSLYRAFKMQEQPVPVEQLLKSPSKLPKILISAAAALLVLGGVGAAFFFVTRPPQAESTAPAVRAPVEYVMSGDSLERRFYKGDSLLVPVGANQYKLELMSLGDAASIRTPQRTLVLNLNEEADEDINNDGIPDLRITAADFVKNNANMGILLRFDINAVPAVVDVPPPEAAPVETAAVSVPANATVVFSSPNSYPFTLQSNFQGYCMFRWEILFERDRPDRNERYFQRSEELNIQAQNGIRIWISNAQAAKFQITGGGRTVPIELGGAGEVVVTDIRWIRDDDNRYRLVIARLET